MNKFSMSKNWVSNEPGGGASSTGTTDGRLSFRQLAAQSQNKPRPNFFHGSTNVRQSDLGVDGREESRKQLYQETSDYLTGVMEAVRSGSDFQVEPAISILKRMSEIQTPFDAFFLKAIHSDDSHNFVVNHSVNLSIYAMKMAERLGYSRSKQVEIGMLALFHDVGMALISDDIIYKKERLSESEFDQLKERPILGYNILKKHEKEYPFLPEGTLQVYERVDGSGYPNGLIGDEIQEYAQIVGLVDVYEALIHTRPQRQRLPHFFAVKEIIRTGKTKFQRRYLKALLNTFSIFPLLSYVRLNSKAVGQVIKTYPEQPMRPKIRVVFDSQNQRVLTERVINLPENPLLYITDSISEEELATISEQAEPVSSKRQAVAKDDEPIDNNGQNAIRRPKKQSPKRKWKVFRIAMASVGIISTFLLSGYYGPVELEAKKNEEITTLANSTDHVFTPSPIKLEQEKELRQLAKLPKANEKEGTTDKPFGVMEPNETLAETSKMATDPTSPEMLIGRWTQAFPYSIKLNSYKMQADAEKAVSEFSAEGIPTYWVKVDLGNDGIWYRVFSGYFEKYETAQKYLFENAIQGALVKRTEYATLLGIFDSTSEADAFIQRVGTYSFCPYLVRNGQKISVLVGAFYTEKGAMDQHSELAASDIMSKVIRR